MSDVLLTLPLVLPLAAAATGLLQVHHPGRQRTLSLLATAGVTATAAQLVVRTLAEGPVATQVGGFPAGVSIALVADGWSSLLLMVTGVVFLACLGFAYAAGDDRNPAFQPLVQILLAGIGLAFLTGDLFNLFVAFEVMLIASYVLCSLGSGPVGRRATFTYVVINLAASTMLLIGAGVAYGVFGTVNLAALHGLVSVTPGATLALTFPLLAFAVKAGLVPVGGWLPTTYSRISPAVAALFSGLLTKVGVYALYRSVTLLFPDRPGIGVLLGGVAAAAMGVAVLQAVGEDGVRRILSFHITSQVGYMVMGLALGGVAGLAGGIAYTIHHIVVKTALFLTAGAITLHERSDDLADLGGLGRRHPAMAVAFGVAAAALAGLPPLSGFVPKLALLQVAFGRGWWLLGGLSLAVSALTLVSMLKIQTGVFWGTDPRPSESDAPATGAGPPGVRRTVATTDRVTPTTSTTATTAARPQLLAAPGLVLAAVAVGLGLAAGPLLQAATTAAEQLADPSGYVHAVLGEAP